jgi:hypothetical protein
MPKLICAALAVYNYAKASGTEAALAGAVEELGLAVREATRRPTKGSALRK